jgi:hypothetical protein
MADVKKTAPKKGFFARMIDAVDKKIQSSASSCGGCCCGSDPKAPKDKKCC